MPGFAFPCNEKAREISESFLPYRQKNDILSSAQGGHASSDIRDTD